MQTFKNPDDVTLHKYPLTPQEWVTNPTIQFTVAKDRIVHKGDRIHCCTTMKKTGPDSGSVIDIYYYINEITDFRPSMVHPSMLTVVTAKAKRLEL
ncbi:hypothetical protein [Flavobacterium sp. AG291]|uniref:hypothetical protein n=1 Tax=Flavobacterium sp. AG291 TaxID=2184000 RepID=UPI000E0CBDB8|nr:hypothetical protein [Flavobacterium sp. AG291]RDI07066.1 hypothetical protein DEU42_113166 [Flavobacterium sp. AG291]